jgi:hypothetical protein
MVSTVAVPGSGCIRAEGEPDCEREYGGKLGTSHGSILVDPSKAEQDYEGPRDGTSQKYISLRYTRTTDPTEHPRR